MPAIKLIIYTYIYMKNYTTNVLFISLLPHNMGITITMLQFTLLYKNVRPDHAMPAKRISNIKLQLQEKHVGISIYLYTYIRLNIAIVTG